MQLNEENVKCFNRSCGENPIFWSRFSSIPSFEGKSVLDVGCGQGALCIDVARSGAERVMGIDIKKWIIGFANNNLRLNFPELENIVEFRVGDITSLAGCEFDLIISKNSFEHILEPDNCLAEMIDRLKSGGKIYIGFSPLYNSPFGDHGRSKTFLPWGHLIVPESVWLSRLNKRYPEKNIRCVADLGLNGASFARFKSIFYGSGLEVTCFAVNRSKHPVVRLFSLLRRVPFLEEYLSCNLYCVLEKTGKSDLPEEPGPISTSTRRA
jgi:SAM-dependent methyltransferase